MTAPPSWPLPTPVRCVACASSARRDDRLSLCQGAHRKCRWCRRLALCVHIRIHVPAGSGELHPVPRLALASRSRSRSSMNSLGMRLHSGPLAGSDAISKGYGHRRRVHDVLTVVRAGRLVARTACARVSIGRLGGRCGAVSDLVSESAAVAVTAAGVSLHEKHVDRWSASIPL